MQDATFGGSAIVADDRAVIRDAVRSALGATWCVFAASNGFEAVEYARSVRAALVILDINMPDLNGIEASALIRSLPDYATVPVVILTAFDNQENRRKARVAGADAILTKPFTSQNLVAVVRPLVLAWAADPGSPDRARQPDGQDILAIHRKVDSVASRRASETFTELLKAWHRDSLR